MLTVVIRHNLLAGRVKGSGLLERVVGDKKDLNQMEMASLCGKDRSGKKQALSVGTMSFSRCLTV